MKNGKPKTLILGLGDDLSQGKCIGVSVIEHLRTIPHLKTVEIIDGTLKGTNLIEILLDRVNVIMVDTAETDAEMGMILRLTPEDFLDQQENPVSLRHLDIPQTLAMTHILGSAPNNVIIFAVVTRNNQSHSELSQTANSSVTEIADLICQEIKKLSPSTD